MKRPALTPLLPGLLLPGLLLACTSAALAQNATTAQPLLQVSPPATPSEASQGAAGAADIDRAAERLASVLDGVIRNCPSDFAGIGTPDKRCIGAAGEVESLRQKLNAAYSGQWYGAWRSRDGQRTVYNWLMLPSGAVYLRLEPENPGRSLLYLDAPAESQVAQLATATGGTLDATVTTVINGVTIRKPAPSAPIPDQAPSKATTTPNPASSNPASQPTAPIPTVSTPAPKVQMPPQKTPETTLASMAFRRSLQLQKGRLHGADVLSVQNRLIALTIGAGPQAGPSQGDGWYGPNTAKAVADFQRANGLKVTGKVDKATWDILFSPSARKFRGQ